MRLVNWPARLGTAATALLLAVACLAESESEPESASELKSEQAGSEATASQSSSTTAQEAKQDPVQTIDAFIESEDIDKSDPSWRLKVRKPPQATFEGDTTHYWVLETNHGQIKIKLLQDTAPMHVSSTIYLTQSRLLRRRSIFHRVITGLHGPGRRSGRPRHRRARATSTPASSATRRASHDKTGSSSAWRTPARAPTAASSS